MLNTKIVQWKSLLTAVWTDPIWNLKSAVLCASARLKQSRGYSWAPCAISSSLQLSGDGQAERRSAEKKGERDKSKYLPLLFLLSLCNLLFNYFCLSGCSTRSHCQSIGATGKMWREVFKAFCKFHGELWTFLFFFLLKCHKRDVISVGISWEYGPQALLSGINLVIVEEVMQQSCGQSFAANF